MKTLPNRPSNPAEISFAADCFEVVGETVVWVVGYSSTIENGAIGHKQWSFDFYDDACAFQKSRGGKLPIRRVATTLRKRIKWK